MTTTPPAAFAPITGTINNISSFGLDQTGNLYIVDHDREVYIVEAGTGTI